MTTTGTPSSAETLRGLWVGLEAPAAPPAARVSALAALGARLAPYLMIAPAAVLLLAVTVYPLYYSVRVSLEQRSGAAVAQYVGLDNYERLLHDAAFWHAAKVTCIYTFSSVSIELLLGLGLAVAVSPLNGRMARTLRLTYVMPMIIAPLIASIIWRILYQTESGPLAYLAAKLGFGELDVLNSSATALPALILVDVWQWTPFMFLILLAGLQSLPTEPYEAARVDGASPLRIFTTVTLPMLWPVLLVALLLRTIDAFGVFDQAFALTGGGPGDSTQVLAKYAYDNAFAYTQLGYAAAVVFAMLLTLVLATGVIVQALRRSRRWL